MTTLDRTSSSMNGSSGLVAAMKRFADEAAVLFQALLSPNTVIAEVEEARALQLDALRIEAKDPARAAVLRWHASRIGIR
ncbi:MAG: hypothetical protein EOP81_09605 [Variovorax sp.]|nr:MAG: hypothetical protein EOP81_09605 [Variovorax sp.]